MYNELQAELSCYCKKAKFTYSKETVIYATISKEVKKLFQCSIAFVSIVTLKPINSGKTLIKRQLRLD